MVSEDDLKIVTYDAELHHYVKAGNRWGVWVNSEEYSKAFVAYWKEGTVPHRIYPKPLVIHNRKEGTVSFVPLEGTHDWRDTYSNNNAYSRFMSTAIFNRNLATWVQKSRAYEKKRNKQRARNSKHTNAKHYHQRRLRINPYIIPQILTIASMIFLFMYLMNSWGIMTNIPYIAITIIVILATIFSFWSFAISSGIIPKIIYFVYGLFCGFISLCNIGVIPADIAYIVGISIPFLIIILILAAICMVMNFLRFFIPSLGIGGGLGLGGAFGGRVGWNLAGKLFGKR